MSDHTAYDPATDTSPNGQGPPCDDPLQTAIVAAYKARGVFIDWAAEWDGARKAVDWLVTGIIERGTITVLYGPRDVGKTLAATDWCLRVVRDGGTVLYVDEENPREWAIERVRDMGADPAELTRFRYASYAELPPLDTPEGGRHLLALAVTAGADLVVLDTTSRMIDGEENSADTFTRLTRHTMGPLRSRGIAVLRLDHPGKDASRGTRGSSAKETDADVIWHLTAVTAQRVFKLSRTRNRSGHAPQDGELFIERRGGRLRPEEGPLRHEWVTHEIAVPEAVLRIARILDEAGVPSQAGRNSAEQVLRDNHHPVPKTTTLAAVIRYRKERAAVREQQGTAGTAGGTANPAGELFPPHTRKGVVGNSPADAPAEQPGFDAAGLTIAAGPLRPCSICGKPTTTEDNAGDPLCYPCATNPECDPGDTCDAAGCHSTDLARYAAGGTYCPRHAKMLGAQPIPRADSGGDGWPPGSIGADADEGGDPR